MKKGIVIAALAAMLAFASLAQAGSTAIVNGLDGVNIVEVYLSHVDTDDWEENLIYGNVLRPGEYVEVQFAYGESACYWDLLAVDSLGAEAVWESLDLCGVGAVTLLPGGEAILE